MWNINDDMVAANTVYQTLVDTVSSNLSYVGSAALGSATSDPKWTIKRVLVDGTITTVSYPIGQNSKPCSDPQFIWDERTLLNYSLIPDTSKPTLTTVTIASNNSDTTQAKVWDTVTITMVASEIIRRPVVVIGSGSADLVIQTTDDKHWVASKIMTASDVQWTVSFTISFKDIGGISGDVVSATTDLSSVSFSSHVTGALTYSIPHAVKTGDTQTITADFSYPLKDSPVVKIALSGSQTVSATVMTKVTASQYTYEHTVGAGDGDCTCAFSVGVDKAGNAITVTPSSGATFVVDNTAPVMSSATRTSDTVLNVELSELANQSSITQSNDGWFVVKQTGAPGIAYVVSDIAPGVDNSHIVLTVANMAASKTAGVTVTYVAADNGIVTDVAGNPLATDSTGVVVAAW